ncbi:DEAD/DEAH box helicase family protein [Arthrobacter sp. STN4]|uniref:DEAD/DEAH box helicase family protein n=1 Tax=Arthrobacter sp. STN4 TaxID=2923276 RepID=UPI002119D05A|nr:DEAD/DEAH box helicase family protein [Arthrobacter sp. STN4]MCQ9163912.1 DEAD/DEAH box helicase family protein [Arthrobacter sp. STN4]
MLAQWPDLALRARKAEQFAWIDPRVSMMYARHTAEHIVDWIYEHESAIPYPYQRDFNGLLNQPEFKALVGSTVTGKLNAIRKAGNNAVHGKSDPSPQNSQFAVAELFHVCYWLARTYTIDAANLPATGMAFDLELLKPKLKTPAPARSSVEAVAKLADELAAKDKELAEARAASTSLEHQLAEALAQIAAAKQRNQATPDVHNYDEALTRAYLIDQDLHDAGWPLTQDEDREYPVTGMPSSSGVGYVDYVLWGADGLPLALVEAKRSTKDPLVGKQQAKLYADCLEQKFGRRPVIYYSNGYRTWLWDDALYGDRPVQGFHTRDQLELMVARRTIRRHLAGEPIDNSIVERGYQHSAIRTVTESFEAASRKALVVMATGTGKTRTAVALSKLLMDANWAKRILFLADRVSLVQQAARAFKTHLPGSAPAILGRDNDTDSRINLATYPTIMNMISGSARGADGQPSFGIGHYDLIIVDEAHRSIYQKYRAIFDYFDSLLLGLTATPQADVDRNTYSMFDIEDNVPTFAYELDEAIEAGYLVPPRVVPVPLKFPYEGIRYDDLSEAEKEQWDELEWDEEGEIPDAVDPAVVNSWLFNTDTVNKALEVLMTRGHKVAGGDRLGKTIIFAKNNDHANFIARQFDKNYPHLKGDFARVITYQETYAQSLIDSFSRTDDNPHIAVSVDMLDTGIDVPEVLNLVFFKMVRSKTKFWQMLGRGTRLRPDLFGPGQDKQDFFIFDLCRNAEYFNAGLPGNEGSVGKSLSETTFATRAKLLVASRAAGLGSLSLVTDLVHGLSGQVSLLPTSNFLVKPHRQAVEKYSTPEGWGGLSDEDVAGLETGLAKVAGQGAPAEKEEAKRFDLIVLNAQLASLVDPGAVDRYRKKIQDIAAALADQPNNPAISPVLVLLEQIADDNEWQSVSLEWLESIRRKLRGLVHLIEKKRRNVVYTNFEDELGELVEIELDGVHSGVNNFDRYRQKAQMYLRSHLDLATLQRLRRNKPLTPLDLAELERILEESGAGTQEDLARARTEGLAHFVRSLVGLDRSAVEEALSEFIAGATFNAAQLDFLAVLTTQLSENGSVDIGALYDSPYSELAPTGPDELFGDDVLDRLELVLRSFDEGLKVG